MLGKYYDTRPQHRFSVIYTAVPYLDTEIFNMRNKLVIEERKAKNRTTKAIEGIHFSESNLGIERARQKS